MKRREFITLLGGAASLSVAAHAQQSMPMIGYLGISEESGTKHIVNAFRSGLKEMGFVEGQNVAIEYRFAEDRVERLPELAADLARRGVGAICTTSNVATLAVKKVNSEIPLVFVTGLGAPAAANPKAAAPSTSAAAPQAKPESNAAYLTDAKYTLRSGIAEGKMVYLGVGGSIDGKANPVLTAAEGQIVQLTLINGEGTEHDIVFPDQDAKSPRVNGKGASTTIVFRATKSGDFIYFCSVPGHQLAGMQGQFLVTPVLAPQTLVEADKAS